MAISVQERRASQQAAQRQTQQHPRGCHQTKRDPNLYDMETFGGQQNLYSPAETWEPNPQSPAMPFRRAGHPRQPSVDAHRLFTPIKRRLPHPTKTENSSSTAPMAKKARTPSQEPEGSEYRPRLLSVETLLQQPTALSPPHHRYVQQPAPQPAQHQTHSFVPSPSNSPIPSLLVASRAFPPPLHAPSMYPHMQGRRCSASPQSRLISREESSSPIIPVASANVHGNHKSGQYANTGPSPSYREQSKRQVNRSSIASSASNTGAGSLDRQPEERLDQQPSVETMVQRLQSMTPKMLEEEFGQLDAARLKELFDSSQWCKDKINKSSNATETLVAFTIELDRSEPSGSGRRACYYCWEKYGEDRFSKEQLSCAILKANGNYKPFNKRRKYPESVNIEKLRQFCTDCGVRLHFYRRYRRFYSLSGPDWWACRCRVLRPVVDEEEPCPDCNCVSPLRNPDEDDDTFESDDSDGSDA